MFSDARFVTVKTKLAASLGAIGLRFKEIAPVMNQYTRDTVPKFSRTDPRWRPGDVSFHMETQTPEGVDAEKLALAWEQGGYDQTFNRHMEALHLALQAGNLGAAKAAFQAVNDILPFALLMYCKETLNAREHLLDMVKRAQEIVYEGDGKSMGAVYSKNATPETKRLLGII